MSKVQITSETRVSHDPQFKAVRSWFAPAAVAAQKSVAGPPLAAAAYRSLAHTALAESANLFNWQADLSDLLEDKTLTGTNAVSVRFVQEFKNVPVDSSEVVVNLLPDGEVYSVYNNYHYDIPRDLDPKKIKIKVRDADQILRRLASVYESSEIREPKLIIYRFEPSQNHPPKGTQRDEQRQKFLATAGESAVIERGERGAFAEPGKHYVAWESIVTTRNPRHVWRVLIDAFTGKVVNVVDLLQYATGSSSVYDPNPIVTSGNAGLSSATPLATLNGQRVPVVLDRLNAAVGGNLSLDGSYANTAEIESPIHPEPVSATGDFTFDANNRDFLAAMTYFHIDRFQHYIQTELGLTNVANFSIPVDPQGVNGADNSRYDPVAKDLAFGEGGIPDAADGAVILHEYGHAIQDNVNPGYGNGNYSSGTSEGFGDFLFAVYYDDKHTNPAATRGATFPWDANTTDGFWAGRRYDVTWLFDGPEFAGASGHGRAQLWSAALFELYRKLGGDSLVRPGVKRAARDLIIRLHLMANSNVPSSGATAAQLGQQIEAADSNLGGWRYANGLHKKVIYDTFRRRHLDDYPDKAVDVYINDGREGGYGSPSGNDLFNENLWDENYWDTQDIWVRTAPYANAAAQATGGPADHVEPPVGSLAYLYVRVKNRGTSAAGSGPVTVKAFHCLPGMGLVWPDAWTPMDTPSINVANILPGPANGVVVGPFPWTPMEVGHECVLAIVECANDRAVTQDLLATDHVAHSDLVPFDNNIEQRNLAPTMAKGKMLRGFFVNNPYTDVRTVQLHFESTLPKGWRWQTGLNTGAIRLGPLERRWVALTIDQADGEEVTRFDMPQRLTVVGTIDERTIGGMTFYIAPPSALGKPPKPDGWLTPRGTHAPGDLWCMNIPWYECEVEGEIEVKIRFRKKD